MSDYQEQIDAKDAKIAELEESLSNRNDKYRLVTDKINEKINRIAELERELAGALQMRIDTHAELIVAWGENSRLQKELAAAKGDLRHNDNCDICVGSRETLDACECDCLDCILDCRCKECRDESKWEWRGLPQEGEGD